MSPVITADDVNVSPTADLDTLDLIGDLIGECLVHHKYDLENDLEDDLQRCAGQRN